MPHETVLVVDDEQLIRKTIARRLLSEGYDVAEAEDGRQAIERAANGADVAILDYRLPDLDGLTVLKELKRIQPDILVILLTAYAHVDTAVQAMKLGAYHFANKPFDLDALCAMVEQPLKSNPASRVASHKRV